MAEQLQKQVWDLDREVHNAQIAANELYEDTTDTRLQALEFFGEASQSFGLSSEERQMAIGYAALEILGDKHVQITYDEAHDRTFHFKHGYDIYQVDGQSQLGYVPLGKDS